jgi:Mn2+/Fe2+ NRAMP family transporter
MGFSFLLTVFFVAPSWESVYKGMVPQIPNEPNAALIVAGIAGTTLSSAMLFCRSISLKAKGWGMANSKSALTDTIVSVSMMFLLSFAVMVCAAGTLYIIGKPVEEAIDMVRTLEPLAGRLASIIFIVGLVGAGVSSLIPTILIAPWLIADFKDLPVNPKSKNSRIFVAIGLLIALIAPFIDARPIFLMIITMALLSIILPLSTISITVLLNQKYLGKNRNSLMMNIGCGGAIIFSIIMSYFGVIGLLEYFK